MAAMLAMPVRISQSIRPIRFRNKYSVLTSLIFQRLKSPNLGCSTRCLSAPPVAAESENHQKTDENEKDVRENILTAALDFVPQTGWSSKSLAFGAEAIGYPGIAHGMFPRGGTELVYYFLCTCNNKHAALLRSVDFEGDTGKGFVIKGLRKRLEMILPFINQWPQAMGIMALPQNVPLSLETTMILMDNVWHFSGDKTTDVSWYTKRIGLGLAYKASELCLIQDKSENYDNTWQFLENRINSLYSANAAVDKIKEGNRQVFEVMKGSVIIAKNILGFQRA